MPVYPKKKVIKAGSGSQILGGVATIAPMFGPVGMAVGAVAGIASAIIGSNEEADEKKRIEDDRRKQEAIQMNNLNEKAGNKAYGSLSYKYGGEVKDREKNTDSVQDKAIIIGGLSHDEGGNKIVNRQSGNEVAESEVAELLLTKAQTDEVEKHIKKYDLLGDVECFHELGFAMVDIIKNAKDYSGRFKL